jgi:hypothetical protein
VLYFHQKKDSSSNMMERSSSPFPNQKLITKASTKVVPNSKVLTKTISNTTNSTLKTDVKSLLKPQTINKDTISKATINSNGIIKLSIDNRINNLQKQNLSDRKQTDNLKIKLSSGQTKSKLSSVSPGKISEFQSKNSYSLPEPQDLVTYLSTDSSFIM